MRRVCVLGATGSIGTQALEVIRAHPNELRAVALAAGGTNVALLAEQVMEFAPELVALADENALPGFEEALREVALARGGVPPSFRLTAGETGITAAASYDAADVVLNAITGAAGLIATLATLESGKTLALANK
ncbi:MAG: 1-deoxy-D-xylulose-5-phosphate reductoisomerase, partial [Propionibacteriaceae bacterium]|nr:1-deoxy-D-xylulose-5-phosphate reductoisomerase [Propionibacteriaceae bacterium]